MLFLIRKKVYMFKKYKYQKYFLRIGSQNDKPEKLK